MSDVYILDAVRTPIGRYNGALAGIRPDDLAAHVIRSLVQRSPELDPARLDDVFFGNANGAGEDNRDVARMASLLAGLPTSVPGVTLNRLCGSGMEALIAANRAIAVGDASLAVAGGVESMTRAPWVLPKPAKGFPAGSETLHSTTLGWRMVNPAMPGDWTVSLGECTELLAEKYGITRQAQDEYALASHQKAVAGWDCGAYSAEVVGYPGVELSRDESIRADSSLAALAKLAPAFRPDGTVTAGNSSPLNDGAAALLIGDEAGARAAGRQPLARIVSRAVAAVEPQFFGIGPVEAASTAPTGRNSTPRSSTSTAALSRSGIRWAVPERGWSHTWRTSCGRSVAATGWLRSASASVRAWPSSCMPDPVRQPVAGWSDRTGCVKLP
jgi:acetyl-CoA acetyltransferase family protein